MKILNGLSLLLMVVGSLNWGLVGFFDFNLVTYIFSNDMIARIIYALVGLAGLWGISFFAKLGALCCCHKSGCKKD